MARPRNASTLKYTRRAQARLRGFMRVTRFAVVLTAIVLIFWSGWESAAQIAQPADEDGGLSAIQLAADEAGRTLRDLLISFFGFLPKLMVALVILAVGMGVARLIRWAIATTLSSWSRASAMSALVSVGIFLITIGAALSVIAGDARTLVGSVGLIGLALSWALQAPIESFTGWLLNSFKGYYRVGDRIEVGDVFGDVYDMDVLTTTVWEAGGPNKPVRGAQPTGSLITFPNSEVLRANIINFTRDFPYVWDELTVGVANESDLSYSMNIAGEVAHRVIGLQMQGPARSYLALLRRRHLPFEVADEPQVFLAPADAWTNLTIRYLVASRERRKWSSSLYAALTSEFSRPKHAGKIISAYPRTEVSILPVRGAFGGRQASSECLPPTGS